MARQVREAASHAPPDTVNNDPSALNPEFRARLDRVMTRMHDEFGHDVEIVEGYRTQDRQNYLFAQGRTRPGDVVTWTKSSKHTSGLAVDVKIDGSYNNQAAYQQLARIAHQEGLRTLGARDPGHLELPSHGGAAAWGDSLPTTASETNVSRAVEMALNQHGLSSTLSDTDDDGLDTQSDESDRINALLGGNIRGSATNATLGLLRDGLSVSNIGQSARFGYSAYRGQPSSVSDMTNNSARGQNASDTTSSVTTPSVAAPAVVATVATVANVAQVASVAMPGMASQMTPSHVATTPTHVMGGTLAADRVGQMLDARDTAPVRPLSQLTVRLNDDQGGTEQIRLNLRGNAVDTHIALNNPIDADRMSLRVGELQHALESRGITADVVHVSATEAVAHALTTAGTTSHDTGAGWTPRHGQTAQGQERSDHRERRSANHRESDRQDADDPRQRARREPRGVTG
jgi:peptidoglycan L-alanyl-D-glutamate endopeptidase CwlK